MISQDKLNPVLRRDDTVRVVAVTLPLLFLLLTEPVVIFTYVFVLITVALWQLLFHYATRRQLDRASFVIGLIYTSVLFMILLPWTIPWWQLVITVSFGVVLGEQVFGGHGYSFVSPVIAGLAFYFYSFTGDFTIPINGVSPFILLVPMIMLVWVSRLAWQTLLGIVSGYLLLQFSLPVATLTTAVVACLIFAACDPVFTPNSRCGKLVYGLLIGTLLFLLDPTLSMLDKAVFACLLGTVAAPLIDWIVTRFAAFIAALNAKQSNHASK